MEKLALNKIIDVVQIELPIRQWARRKYVVAEVQEVASGKILGRVIRSYDLTDEGPSAYAVLEQLNAKIGPLGLVATGIGCGSFQRATDDAVVVTSLGGTYGTDPDLKLTIKIVQAACPFQTVR